jgi:hypothetical protein
MKAAPPIFTNRGRDEKVQQRYKREESKREFSRKTAQSLIPEEMDGDPRANI